VWSSSYAVGARIFKSPQSFGGYLCERKGVWTSSKFRISSMGVLITFRTCEGVCGITMHTTGRRVHFPFLGGLCPDSEEHVASHMLHIVRAHSKQEPPANIRAASLYSHTTVLYKPFGCRAFYAWFHARQFPNCRQHFLGCEIGSRSLPRGL
jgi:hypothetical protein